MSYKPNTNIKIRVRFVSLYYFKMNFYRSFYMLNPLVNHLLHTRTQPTLRRCVINLKCPDVIYCICDAAYEDKVISAALYRIWEVTCRDLSRGQKQTKALQIHVGPILLPYRPSRQTLKQNTTESVATRHSCFLHLCPLIFINFHACFWQPPQFGTSRLRFILQYSYLQTLTPSVCSVLKSWACFRMKLFACF
jgi:hypothetical protein